MVSPESVLKGVVWNQPLIEGSYVSRTGEIYDKYHDRRTEQLNTMASQLPPEIGLRYPSDYDEAAAAIYQSPEITADVLAQLGVKEYGEITSADTALFQAGMHALVGLTVLRTTLKPAQYAVTTLSRGNLRTPTGIANTREMSDLTSISNALEEGLKPEYKSRVSAVKPIAKGTVRVNEADYPYFVAPFCPYGELHVYVEQVTKSAGVPIVKYPVPYNRQMIETNNMQDDHLDRFVRFLSRDDRLMASRESRYLENNLRSLFIAQMAIYFAAGQRFPENFWLSAGDLMGKIYSNGTIDTALITCRGGLGSKTPFLDFMKARAESVEGDSTSAQHKNISIQGQIFAGFAEQDAAISTLNETLGMFRDDRASTYRNQLYIGSRRTK